MVAGSFGSKAMPPTNRPGRLRVMSVRVKPPGTSASVETRTRPPTVATTLLLLVGATSTSLAIPGSGALLGHVDPPSVLCQRFWLLLAYTQPLVFGSVATAARYTPTSAADHGG